MGPNINCAAQLGFVFFISSTFIFGFSKEMTLTDMRLPSPSLPAPHISSIKANTNGALLSFLFLLLAHHLYLLLLEKCVWSREKADRNKEDKTKGKNSHVLSSL